MKFFVHLKSMSIILREQQQKPELLDIVVEEFSTLIVQRPGAQSVKLVLNYFLLSICKKFVVRLN